MDLKIPSLLLAERVSLNTNTIAKIIKIKHELFLVIELLF